MGHWRIVLDADDFGRSAPLSLEGKEPFGVANVKNAHPRHVGRQSVMRQFVDGGFAPSGSPNSSWKLDAMKNAKSEGAYIGYEDA
jgi:hypothetical protein